MEVFATFGLIMLVGLAFPIALLFMALLFDLAVFLYVVITTKPSQKRKPRSTLVATGRDRVKHRRIAFAH
ncbi:MAG: hypothetical protein ACXU9O_01795 [Gemmatimonadaceae bacterium]